MNLHQAGQWCRSSVDYFWYFWLRADKKVCFFEMLSINRTKKPKKIFWNSNISVRGFFLCLFLCIGQKLFCLLEMIGTLFYRWFFFSFWKIEFLDVDTALCIQCQCFFVFSFLHSPFHVYAQIHHSKRLASSAITLCGDCYSNNYQITIFIIFLSSMKKNLW